MAASRTTYLGTPIVSYVSFHAPDKDFAIKGFDFEGNESIQLNDVLVSVTQPKNIVKTSLVRPQGDFGIGSNEASRNSNFDGTVKEYVSLSDYAIRLQGMLVGEEIDIFPDVELDSLMEYLTYPGAFRIVGRFVARFANQQVIVNDFNISEQRGFTNTVPFTINLLTDEALEVKYAAKQATV